MKKYSMLILFMLMPISQNYAAQAEQVGLRKTEAASRSAGTTFSELSHGNRVIARSLLDAQVLPEDNSAQAWTLDQIAASRSKTGWAQVFQQMQAEGLMAHKNLGQAVKAYTHDTRHTLPEGLFVKVTGDNSLSTRSSRRNRTDQTRVHDNNTRVPETHADEFNKLSTGNRKIARALLEAQVLPTQDHPTDIWTLDRIAAARKVSGWGNVFAQMQSEGLITARNLGQVVSQYQNNTHLSVFTEQAQAISASSAIDLNKTGKFRKNGVLVNDITNTGEITVNRAGMKNLSISTVAAQQFKGTAYGIMNNPSFSANQSITTAAGAEMVNGLNHGVHVDTGTSISSRVSGLPVGAISPGNHGGKGYAFGHWKK